MTPSKSPKKKISFMVILPIITIVAMTAFNFINIASVPFIIGAVLLGYAIDFCAIMTDPNEPPPGMNGDI